MITFCIPSKNNLRYLKSCIPSIQKNSHYKNDIIVFIDQDNDGTEEWLKEHNISYILNSEPKCKGIGYAYDTMFKHASTEYVLAFHADMILGKDADLNLLKHHIDKTIVCSTRIEPPLHPPSPDKISIDLGLWPEDFLEDKFNEQVKLISEQNNGKTNQGIFAPWLIKKSEHINHDPIFLSVFEDSDLFLRYKISGFNLIQSLDSIVYHLTCRGGQFEHASSTSDLNIKSNEWKRKSDISQKEFLRKWGFLHKNTVHLDPIPSKKYNTAFIIHNCSLLLLEALEPWCDRIYVNEKFNVGRSWDYIEKESENTSFDLSKRVLNIKENDPYSENDIILEFDALKFSPEAFNIIQNLSDIITESGEVGQFELDCFKITIHNIKDYSNELIYIRANT